MLMQSSDHHLTYPNICSFCLGQNSCVPLHWPLHCKRHIHIHLHHHSQPTLPCSPACPLGTQAVQARRSASTCFHRQSMGLLHQSSGSYHALHPQTLMIRCCLTAVVAVPAAVAVAACQRSLTAVSCIVLRQPAAAVAQRRAGPSDGRWQAQPDNQLHAPAGPELRCHAAVHVAAPPAVAGSHDQQPPSHMVGLGQACSTKVVCMHRRAQWSDVSPAKGCRSLQAGKRAAFQSMEQPTRE